MAQYEHDVTKVDVIVTTSTGVVFSISGGEKEKIRYKRSNPYFVYKDDVGGSVGRGVNPSRRGEFTIKLLKANPQNELMQALVTMGQDEGMQKLGLDCFTITVVDRLTGRVLCMARLCSIEEQPEGIVELEPTETEWKGMSADMTIQEGGGLMKL